MQNNSEVAAARQGVYEAMIAYDDARTNVANLTRMTGDAYRDLCRAIGGHGDLAEAKARFELEVSILADAHAQLVGKAALVNAAVADGDEWLRCFALPSAHCATCGAAWSPSDPWVNQTVCNLCAATGVELRGRRVEVAS